MLDHEPPRIWTLFCARRPGTSNGRGQPPLRIELLRTIDGVDTEGVFARAVAGRWSDLAIQVIALDDLIQNKQAAGRPQDLADVKLLQRVRSRPQ
jgi:hypothetical protein